MSSHDWKVIYQTIVRMNRGIERAGRRCRYSDTLIVAMFFWSVAHDRPRCWAADRANYHGPFRPRRLASRSQFGRRLASPRCQALMEAVWKALAEGDDGPTWNFMDGRALPVGPYSQDAEAGRGIIARRFAKGYKLHVISNIDGKIAAWRVTPLNVSEKTVADELIVEAKATGWLLADGGYDAGRLYDLACRHGAVMFTPLPKNAGGGHRPQSRMRLLAARLWEIPGAAQMYGLRTTIERQFSQLSSFGGGLGPLPPWVRGLQRVTQWVGTKLMFYHVRLTSREAAA